jgi:hypothetical protein
MSVARQIAVTQQALLWFLTIFLSNAIIPNGAAQDPLRFDIETTKAEWKKARALMLGSLSGTIQNKYTYLVKHTPDAKDMEWVSEIKQNKNCVSLLRLNMDSSRGGLGGCDRRFGHVLRPGFRCAAPWATQIGRAPHSRPSCAAS